MYQSVFEAYPSSSGQLPPSHQQNYSDVVAMLSSIKVTPIGGTQLDPGTMGGINTTTGPSGRPAHGVFFMIKSDKAKADCSW